MAGYLLLYGFVAGFLLWSWAVDKHRTRLALRKSRNAFSSILPDFLAVLGLVGLVLTVLPPGASGPKPGTGHGRPEAGREAGHHPAGLEPGTS